MRNSKEILVTTTSTLEGYEVIEYIKPITAHVVAGTNLFSDFFASFTDVFGGRSNTYQKQLASLNNEAIERLKKQAAQLGSNCILGLNIDMDEISGKGKSMFMITAIGTAVIINDEKRNNKLLNTNNLSNVPVEMIQVLKKKLSLIEKSNSGVLVFDDIIWEFIITNKISELYEFIILQLKKRLQETSDSLDYHYKNTLIYLSTLTDEFRIPKIYNTLLEESDTKMIDKLCELIKELELLNFDKINLFINNEDFTKQKLALRLLKFDKPFYEIADINTFSQLIQIVNDTFPERGVRSTKKMLLSTKEKDVWVCECKKTNDIGTYCDGCLKDIYGFYSQEVNPHEINKFIEIKARMIKKLIS